MNTLFRVFVTTLAVLLVGTGCAANEPEGLAESGVANAATSDSAGTAEPDQSAGEGDQPEQTGDSTGAVARTGVLAQSALNGVFLDQIVVQPEGSSLTVRFTMSTTREGSVNWYYELTERATLKELALPTGMTIVDLDNGVEYGVLRSEDGGCVCSQLTSFDASGPVEYFATFDNPGVTDFEVNIPTFPLITVRDNVAIGPTDLVSIGLTPASTSGDGLQLDAVAARRGGRWTVVEFSISNPTDQDLLWYYDLAASATLPELNHPTGVTLFDPDTQTLANPVVPENRACVCSLLNEGVQVEGTATYFAVFDVGDSGSGSVSIPGFPQTAAVPIVDAG